MHLHNLNRTHTTRPTLQPTPPPHTDRSNGCLWGLKGSHTAGVARRFVRNAATGALEFDRPAPSYDLGAFDPIEVKAGTLVLLHGANV